MQNLFSYPLKLEDMSQATQKYVLKANSKELEYITELMKVPAVKSFSAEINVKLLKKEHIVEVNGFVDADVEQTSVISLENFIKPYHSDFSLRFDTKMTLSELKELDFEYDDEVLDILDNGQIDLASIAMEHLALVLDDFPRKDGEVFSFCSEFDEETTEAANPFAVLKKLKK
ncbi:MAG: DUF177 domain-containing protein [Alphaproteobacteria bacterium]|nr:DUF177 domain-containing protein [Alphaproteobacteria bacterium]